MKIYLGNDEILNENLFKECVYKLYKITTKEIRKILSPKRTTSRVEIPNPQSQDSRRDLHRWVSENSSHRMMILPGELSMSRRDCQDLESLKNCPIPK